jgi:hypothetical protein
MISDRVLWYASVLRYPVLDRGSSVRWVTEWTTWDSVLERAEIFLFVTAPTLSVTPPTFLYSECRVQFPRG